MRRVVHVWDGLLVWIGSRLYDPNKDEYLKGLARQDEQTALVEQRIRSRTNVFERSYLPDGSRHREGGPR